MTETEWMTGNDPAPMLQEALRRKVSDRRLRLFAVAVIQKIEHLVVDVRSQKAVRMAERFADGAATAGALARARRQAERAEAEANERIEALIDSSPRVPKSSLPKEYQAMSTWRIADPCPDVPWVECKKLEASMWAAGAVVCSTAGPRSRADLANADNMAGWAAAHEAMTNVPEPVFMGDDKILKMEETFWRQRRVQHVLLLRDIIRNPFHRPKRKTRAVELESRTVQRLAQSIYEDRAFDRLPIVADALEEAGCTDAEILAHCRGPGPHVRGCWVVDLLLGKE
jgi:hypothetical protein